MKARKASAGWSLRREEREQLQSPPHFCTSRYSPRFTPEAKQEREEMGGGDVEMLMV